MTKWRCTAVCLLAGCALVAGCGDDTPNDGDDGRATVFVTVEPLAFFVQRIAGDATSVEVLVQAGQDPHTYEPTPRQMVRLAGAKLLFRVGAPFEKTITDRLAANEATLKIVDLSEGVELLETSDQAHTHDGEDHRDHDGDDEMDPHIWLSPRIAQGMARTICEELCVIDADGAEQYRENLRILQTDLKALDTELAEALAPLKGRTFYVFHPAFGYFARDYGLRQEAVETGGKAPGPRHIQELIDRAKADGVKVVFVQPQFSPRAATAIARQIGGAVVPLDPLARDYVANLRLIAKELNKALKGGGS